MDRYLVVLAGAGLGGLARYIAGSWIMATYGGRFPLGTLVINVTGSFFAGALMSTFNQRTNLHPNWRLFLMVGVLGGYTTFSGFELEIFQTARANERGIAVLYLASSVVLGYLGVWLGAVLAARR